MIFTKEQANEALVKAYKAKGFEPTPQTLEQAEKLYAFAGEDETLESFSERCFPYMISVYGEANKLYADKLKEIKPKDPVVEPEPQNPESKPDNDVASILAEIKAEREALAIERKDFRDIKDEYLKTQAISSAEERRRNLTAEAERTYGKKVVELSTIGFDFKAEGAEQSWKERITQTAKSMGTEPIVGGEAPEGKIDTSMAKAKLEAERKANEAAK